MHPDLHSTAAFHRSRGVSLIELMVALVIGLFLILGAVTVMNQSRSTYRSSESLARLQETGRLAMDVIESDVRMANYWGMGNRAEYIVNRATAGQSAPAEFTGTQVANVSRCGAANSNWVIDVEQYLVGINNAYTLTCGATDYLPTTDVLIIRRANESAPAALDVNRVYIQASRIQATLFIPTAGCTTPTDPTCVPADYQPPTSTSRELEARVYYVSSTSTLRDDVPALRRKRFANVNSATAAGALVDEEIAPGVEDLQIRLGVDDNDADTNIDQYVNPGAVPAGSVVVSVVIWLRIRADDPEVGFVDDTSYQYADMAAAFQPNDGFRRIVVTRTIQIRNTRV